MVYSEAFGKRFSLPAGGIQPLDPGLQAVVVRVVQRTGREPGCYLDLYVDDSLNLAFPEGSEGLSYRPDDEDPFFFVRGAALRGPAGHRWDAMLGGYRSVACRKGRDYCMVDEEGGPVAYSRHLVPGTAYQTYEILCDSLEPKHGPTEMWLLRSGHSAEGLRWDSKDEHATYRFAMPAALFEHAAPRLRQATKYLAEHWSGPDQPRGQFSVPPEQHLERSR
jgi:hypothetical protein